MQIFVPSVTKAKCHHHWGRYAKGNQTKEMVDAARHGYRTNIKMGETPFSHVDTFWNAMKGSAKISTVSGAVQAGTLNCDFNDGQKHHERGGVPAWWGSDCTKGEAPEAGWRRDGHVQSASQDGKRCADDDGARQAASLPEIV